MNPRALIILALLAGCSSATPAPDASTPSDAATATDAQTSELCREYCLLAQSHCDGANQLYATEAACQTACAAFPVTGARGDQAGNSIYCRLYHVDQPAAMTPALHCPHAGPSGGGVCQ